VYDTIFKAMNYKGDFSDITQEVYLKIEGDIISAVFADPKCPHNHTVVMNDDVVMCNGLNGWVCSKEIDEFLLRLRKTIWMIFAEIVRDICHNNSWPGDRILAFLSNKLSIVTLPTNNIKESLLLIKNTVFTTILDSATCVFGGNDGETVLRQLEQNCNDHHMRECLEIVGRRIHPLVKFTRLEFLKNERRNFHSTDDVVEVKYPSYEFLKENIIYNPNCLSQKTINWILTEYKGKQRDEVKIPWDINTEIWDKFGNIYNNL
jgi:hypothetical protein